MVKPLIFAGIALILPKTSSQTCYELDLTGRDPIPGNGSGGLFLLFWALAFFRRSYHVVLVP